MIQTRYSLAKILPNRLPLPQGVGLVRIGVHVPVQEQSKTPSSRSNPSIHSKNHLNEAEKAVEEIIDMLAFGELFLTRLGMTNLEAIANRG